MNRASPAGRALSTFVVFFAVWAGYDALQGEGVDLLQALAVSACAALGALLAAIWASRRHRRLG